MKTSIYRGRKVTLDKPIREVKNNKEYKVYVLNRETGNVNLVRFGDKNLSLKSHIPARRKSYCARSESLGNSKLKANYWSRKRWKC